MFKDFVLRELIFWFSGSEDVQTNELKYMFIDKIGFEYNKFIMYDFVQWINLMLATEIFQSYHQIVTPKEAIEKKKSPNMETLEALNYQNLMRENLKMLINSQTYITNKRKKREMISKGTQNTAGGFGEIHYSEETDCFQLKLNQDQGLADSKDLDLSWDEVVNIQGTEIEEGEDTLQMESDSFIQDYMTKNTFDLGHGATTSHMPQSLFYSKDGSG